MTDYSPDEPQVTLWYTVRCPNCGTAPLVCDGSWESCELCGYSRDWLPDPPLVRWENGDERD